MAVYTKIDKKDLITLSHNYKLGKITKTKGIKKGKSFFWTRFSKIVKIYLFFFVFKK